MSQTILRDQQIFLDGYQIDSLSNSCSIEAKKDVVDVTTFGNSDRVKQSGLFDLTFSVGGFIDYASAVDSFLWTEISDTDIVISVIPQTPALGGIAYLMNAIESDIRLLGKVGEAAPFQIGAAGDSLMTRGTIILLPTTPITTTGTSAVYQNTAAAVGKRLKLAVHVIGITGTGSPSITFILKSSQVVGMTSPTTLITTTSINAVNAAYAEALLAATDTYFQLSYTVTGSTPSFSVLGSFSIV